MGWDSRVPGRAVGGLAVTSNRERAEALAQEVHDPSAAALVYALLAIADSLGDPPPPEPDVPFEQTKAGWQWGP